MQTGLQPRLKYLNFIGTLLLVTVIILLSGITARAESPSETAKSSIPSASEIDYLPFCVVDQENRASGFSVELICAAFDIETILGKIENHRGRVKHPLQRRDPSPCSPEATES